ncbi:MAG: glycine--tRNA ligase subunit beta [Fimbriimonadaceae bacterium]|nr:glycine--tRNA ligase subunit beta [Fimbriimonadaceae bacterium]
MPELFVELGCEELPPSFVRKAASDLSQQIQQRLEAERIGFIAGSGPFGTPRRLIVHLADVDAQQPDLKKRVRGPSEAAAFGPEGSPLPALQGFCRSAGVDPSEVEVEGGYVWAAKVEPGKPTLEVLRELLPAAIRSLSFEKSTRWSTGRLKFARPIRWVVAVLGGQTVEFELESVRSGRASRGHRFLASGSFEVASFDDLMSGLRERFVEPDPAQRERMIREGSLDASSGMAELTDALVDENVMLTEWPIPTLGGFDEGYLALPEPVLVTAMAKHERMFPVRSPSGELLPQFVFVRNSGEESVVSEGARWVLSARFNDAKFFFEEDRARTLEEFRETTAGILLHEKLGSILDRSNRIGKLAEFLARTSGQSDEVVGAAAEAGRLCKADLSTGLVSELASLQGIVGGIYARRDGLPEAVAAGIEGHYDLGRALEAAVKGEPVALLVLIADQLDKLFGYLSVGLAPSGSSDPYGLRRAAGQLIEAAWNWAPGRPLYLLETLYFAGQNFESQGIDFDEGATIESLTKLFFARYEALLPDAQTSHLEAAAGSPLLDALCPRHVRLKLQVIGDLISDREFVFTATRPINIFASALEKGLVQVDDSNSAGRIECLESETGERLCEAERSAHEAIVEAVEAEDAAAAVRSLRALQAPINEFFETTLVMAEDPQVRAARLMLAGRVARTLRLGAGDLSKVVVEGGAD